MTLLKLMCPLQDHKEIDTTYTNNAESMLGYVYHAQFWTATKKS